MEQALFVTQGIIITLMLYFDRARRADNAQLRKEMNDGREEACADNAQLRKEMNDGFKRVHKRIDKLTDTIMDLCRRVGRLEGRAESSEPLAFDAF